MNAPGPFPILRIFLRSMLIQGAWNYRGMQHLGFLWAQLPALPRAEAARRQALGRAFEFYNAHPYLCGYLLGAAARLEEEGQGEALARLKRAAIPPLGAVGDRLFWAGLKPLSGVLAVLALLPAARHPGGSLLLALGVGAALLATAAYNWAHLAWRWRALREGHRLGLGVSAAIRALASHPLVAGSSTALALAAGLALPMALPWAAGAGDQAGTGLFFVVALASWQLPARSWTLPLLLVALLAAWTL